MIRSGHEQLGIAAHHELSKQAVQRRFASLVLHKHSPKYAELSGSWEREDR
jgi:hypothetical protein